LLDEPFAALDEETRFKLAEDLRALWLEKKMTIVFVTHSIHEACFLSNRILTLSNKPGHFQHDIKINLPEKRTKTLRTDAVFTEELKRIYAILNSQQSSWSSNEK
jgi:NitT/TauT family transport system ATP-binding protein